jgi:hypothetical protein
MPESWNTETQPGKSVHVGGDLPKPSLAHPESQRAVVETRQQWRKQVLKLLSTHSRRDTVESSGQQKENIVLLLGSLLPHSITPLYISNCARWHVCITVYFFQER